jgi:hypothetical protein
MECTMGYNTGSGPGTSTAFQQASRSPDADLISFTIADICDGITCDDGNECTDDVCLLDGTCSYPSAPANGLACDFGGSAGACLDGACVELDPPAEATSIPVVCDRGTAQRFETALDTTIDPGIAYAGESFTATSSATSLSVTQEMLQSALDYLFLLDKAWAGFGPVTQLEVNATYSSSKVHAASGVTGNSGLTSVAPPYIVDLPTTASTNPYPTTGGEPCTLTAYPPSNTCPFGGFTDLIPPGCIDGFCGQTCTGGFCDPLPCPTAESCPRRANGGVVLPFANATLMGANTVGAVGEQVCFDQEPFGGSSLWLSPPGAPNFPVSWLCGPGTLASPSGPIIPNPISEPPLMCTPVVPFCAIDSDCPQPTEECRVPACVDGACPGAVASDGTPCDDLLPTTAGVCAGGTCVDAMLCAGVDCDDGIPCTEDSCDLTTGDCVHRSPPAGGCIVTFNGLQSELRHFAPTVPYDPACLDPDLSGEIGADLLGISGNCFTPSPDVNTGYLQFRDLGSGQWEVSGVEKWLFNYFGPVAVEIDSEILFTGTGTGTLGVGGQITLDSLPGDGNVNALEYGIIQCSGDTATCDPYGYPGFVTSLPWSGDPGTRTLPTIRFETQPGGELGMMFFNGPNDNRGWYLRNPAPMPYDGTEWASWKGERESTYLDFCFGIDCDDSDECTTDSCDDGTCSNVVRADGSWCDFGGAPGACIGGTCESICNWLNCGDNNECTYDSCDPVAGACVNAPAANGTSCLGGSTSCFDGVCQGKAISLACTNTLSPDTHYMDVNLIVEPIGVTEIQEHVPFDAIVRAEVIFPQYILDELDVILAAKISDLSMTVRTDSSGNFALTVQQPSASCSADGSPCDPANDDPAGTGINPDCTSTFDDRCDLWFHNMVSTDCSPGGTCEMIGKADQCTAFNRCVTGPVVFPLEPVVVAFPDPFFELHFDIEVGASDFNLDGTYQIPPADLDPLLNGPNYAVATALEATAAMNCIMAVDSDGPDGIGVPGGASPSPYEAALVLPVRPFAP